MCDSFSKFFGGSEKFKIIYMLFLALMLLNRDRRGIIATQVSSTIWLAFYLMLFSSSRKRDQKTRAILSRYTIHGVFMLNDVFWIRTRNFFRVSNIWLSWSHSFISYSLLLSHSMVICTPFGSKKCWVLCLKQITTF